MPIIEATRCSSSKASIHHSNPVLDGGRSWQAHIAPHSAQLSRIDLIDPTHWRLLDGSDFVATDDGGVHWRTIYASTAAKGPIPSATAYTLDFLTPSEGWANPDNDGAALSRTDDGGLTWAPVEITAGPCSVLKQERHLAAWSPSGPSSAPSGGQIREKNVGRSVCTFCVAFFT